jgi:hypothetical protein
MTVKRCRKKPACGRKQSAVARGLLRMIDESRPKHRIAEPQRKQAVDGV